jgi:phospholipase/carboxylesterase
MKVNPHLQQPLIQHGAPLSSNNPVLLALHGRNQTPEVVIDIFERMAWHEATLLAPNANNQTWYPARFMEPIEQNEPDLTYALEALEARITDLGAQGVGKERLVLLGFSQGGCLIAQYLVQHPAHYKGIAIFTGGVIGPPGTQWNPKGSLEGTSILLTTCDTDEWVPLERVQETTVLFRAMGANVTEKVYQGREHLVCDDEIEMAKSLFQIGL